MGERIKFWQNLKELERLETLFLFLRNFKPDVIIETDSLLIIKHQLKQVLVGYEVTIFKPKTYQNPSLRYPSLTSFPSRTELWGKVPRPVWVANQRPHLCLWKAKPTWPRRWQWFICDSKKNTEEEGDWMFYMNLLDSGWCFQTCFIVLRFYPSFEQIRLRWILLQWVQAMNKRGISSMNLFGWLVTYQMIGSDLSVFWFVGIRRGVQKRRSAYHKIRLLFSQVNRVAGERPCCESHDARDAPIFPSMT